jgi:CubicO group peptidase (beta-lactamase class C family)
MSSRTRHIASAGLTISLVCATVCGPIATLAHAQSTPPPMDTTQSPSRTAAVAIPAGQIDRAVQQLDKLVTDVLRQTHVPGLALSVVRDGRTVYAKGFGVRRVGSNDAVDADTVFQLASLSKSVGATVVAHAVGEGIVTWNTPVVQHLPWFALDDAWVTAHVTIADLYAHRSGLPDHAGDDLEDIGYDRRQVLQRLRFAPLHAFRAEYAYTNFGVTAAAESVAEASGTDWASLSETSIYQPLGMSSTSSRFADFEHRSNRAVGHVRTGDGSFQPKYQRQPDAQSPAGGVSSSANDMARWMSMVLQNGEFEGRRIVAAKPLLEAITPQVISTHAGTADSRAGFYGYGFGVGASPSGRVVISHSGAFALGAATNYILIPSVGVGIVVLSNAAPIGAVEAIGMEFADLVQFGSVTRDWLGAYARLMASMSEPFGSLVGKMPPASPTAALPLASYVGSYTNDYFGDVRVAQRGDTLVLSVGPKPVEYPLRHWDGPVFVFDVSGENAPDGSVSAVTFAGGASAPATSLAIEFFVQNGKGTFVRN